MNERQGTFYVIDLGQMIQDYVYQFVSVPLDYYFLIFIMALYGY